MNAAVGEAIITFMYLALQVGLRRTCNCFRISKNRYISIALMYINMTGMLNYYHDHSPVATRHCFHFERQKQTRHCATATGHRSMRRFSFQTFFTLNMNYYNSELCNTIIVNTNNYNIHSHNLKIIYIKIYYNSTSQIR